MANSLTACELLLALMAGNTTSASGIAYCATELPRKEAARFLAGSLALNALVWLYSVSTTF